MQDERATLIEAYLLASGEWVSAAEICRVFEVNERKLRADGRQLGLCSGCAISGDKGFRHVRCATDEEFAHAYGRMRRHGLGELVHARRLRAKRHQITISLQRPPLVFERATGQALLLSASENHSRS